MRAVDQSGRVALRQESGQDCAGGKVLIEPDAQLAELGAEETRSTPTAVGGEGERQRRLLSLEKAVKVWSGQLVDLGGRNNLLYYKDLKRGTLDLENAAPDRVADVLAGKVVAISRLFSEDEEREDAVKRARTIRNKAEEHFEERGLQTLYIACGMATWTNARGTATPAAPVLLCPVRLAPRGAAQEDFDLSFVGELEVNPTLLQLLSTEFDCGCKPEELLERVDIEGAIDTPEELEAVYDWLSQRAAAVPGFAITPRLVLGTFSYAKLPMVNDLQEALEALIQHDLIAAIAGDPEARAALAERGAHVEVTDPNHVPLADEFLVLDADSSQNYAINAVIGGQDLIIKGPPGTGKSQTIANLISTGLARGQKILFVAEKRAAIDAVLKRLTERGLGDLVLDLHSGTGSKRKLAASIAGALTGNGAIPRPQLEQQHAHVEKRRGELNARVDALHAAREPWGISVYDIQVRLMGLPAPAQSGVRFRGEVLEGLGAATYRQARENLREYAGLGGLTLAASDSPWSNAQIVSPEQAAAARDLTVRIQRQTLPSAMRALTSSAQATGLTPPAKLSGWQALLRLWSEAAELHTQFNEALWEQDLAALCQQLEPLSHGALKRAASSLSSGEFRQSRKLVNGLLKDGQRLSPADLHARLVAARDLALDWSEVAAAPGARPQPTADLEIAAGSCDQLRLELEELATYIAAGSLFDLSDAAVSELLTRLLADQVTLNKLAELHRLRTALQAAGLSELLQELSERQPAPETALAILEFAWLSSLLEEFEISDSLVGAFDGDQHRRNVDEFKQGDAKHIETSAQRVRRACAERATQAQDEFRTEADLVKNQAARKRGHLPLRQLFGAAPNVLTALKPCWAMSPLVVSQLLPSDKQYFDLVIFDEASQITPADAVPAILRGKRVVVAGDDRQLPPTSFFAASAPDSEGTEEELLSSLPATEGFESVLDQLGAFLAPKMLTWHYRSRDERLIAFSNSYLYDRQLTTFPGVTGEECLEHVLVPWRAGEVGSEQSAAAEVREVVSRILEHARERPDESLGVIAMGIKHADRIDEALRQELSDHPELEDFFSEGREERFFVKNLERVQGDERDAIILSVGYGKNADGRLLYRFGPLNQQGGERRLNVAVTRAKKRMTLVSSFSAADMDPNRSSAEGVKLLRLYLQYAESRGANLGDAAKDKPELNPFEVDVRDTLTKAGIPLVAQYGCSGYWIDFAAQHPRDRGRMVLAIECDGAAYHSSPTARDRDRLRQDQLERLGWTFHRIWSSDWFHHKEQEVARAVEAYELAVKRADAVFEADDPPAGAHGLQTGVDAPAPIQANSAVPERGPKPRFIPYQPIDAYSSATLRAVVRWVQSDTLLRTEDQLITEVMSELGFMKRGKKIVAAISAAIAAERTAR